MTGSHSGGPDGDHDGQPADRDGRPNLVLFTVDSLRADHCGFHDPPVEREGPGGAGHWDGTLTPTLDALADDGLVFADAVAPGPRTPSSVPVSFTGEFLRPGVYDGWETKSERWRERRDRIRRHMRRHRTLAERLRARGYDTGAVTANPWTARDTGFDAGFDEFTAVGDDVDVDPSGLVPSLLDTVAGVDDNGWLLTWEDFYDHVRRTRAALSEPYLLWVFLLDPHQPYLTPRRHREDVGALGMYYANYRYNRHHGYMDELPEHLHARLTGAYRDTVRSTDACLARLRDDLAADDPTYVVHADHGEAFREHGVYSHRLQCYEENVHVPLVVSGPAVGTDRVTGPLSLRRLAALVADLSDGRDPRRHVSPYAVCRTEEGERTAVRSAGWKFVRGGRDWPYVRGGDGRELYDLAVDPGETTDRLDDHPEAADLFDALLDRHETDIAERVALERAAGVLARRGQGAGQADDLGSIEERG